MDGIEIDRTAMIRMFEQLGGLPTSLIDALKAAESDAEFIAAIESITKERARRATPAPAGRPKVWRKMAKLRARRR